MDFLLAAAAVFTALALDRLVGSAVQLWGTRRVGQLMIQRFDAALHQRQEQLEVIERAGQYKAAGKRAN